MAGPTTLYQTGVHGSRPAASSGCVLYSCTTHNLVYRSDGSSWTTWLTFGTGTSSTTMANDTLWAAAGDIALATGNDAAGVLSIGAVGKVLRSNGTTLAYAYPPAYEFDYVQITSPVAITAQTEALANTVVTGSAVTYDGSTIVMVEFFAPYAYTANVANVDMSFWLYDGSSSIGLIGMHRSETTNRGLEPIKLERRLTPSNASHTYSVRASQSTATAGAVSAGAGGSGAEAPAFIRIVKV